MKHNAHYLIFFLLFSTFAHADDRNSVDKFINEFAQSILSKCDEYLTTCNSRRLKIIEKREQSESNEQDQTGVKKLIYKLLQSDGIEIDVFFYKKTGKPKVIRSITVTGKDYVGPLGVTIGTGREKIIQILGAPHNLGGDTTADPMTASRFGYVSDKYQSNVSLDFTKNKVSSIRWETYVD